VKLVVSIARVPGSQALEETGQVFEKKRLVLVHEEAGRRVTGLDVHPARLQLDGTEECPHAVGQVDDLASVGRLDPQGGGRAHEPRRDLGVDERQGWPGVPSLSVRFHLCSSLPGPDRPVEWRSSVREACQT
jgi:hypothetical protein